MNPISQIKSKHISFNAKLLLITSVVLMTACGGGDDSSSNNNGGVPSPNIKPTFTLEDQPITSPEYTITITEHQIPSTTKNNLTGIISPTLDLIKQGLYITADIQTLSSSDSDCPWGSAKSCFAIEKIDLNPFNILSSTTYAYFPESKKWQRVSFSSVNFFSSIHGSGSRFYAKGSITGSSIGNSGLPSMLTVDPDTKTVSLFNKDNGINYALSLAQPATPTDPDITMQLVQLDGEYIVFSEETNGSPISIQNTLTQLRQNHTSVKSPMCLDKLFPNKKIIFNYSSLGARLYDAPNCNITNSADNNKYWSTTPINLSESYIRDANGEFIMMLENPDKPNNYNYALRFGEDSEGSYKRTKFYAGRVYQEGFKSNKVVFTNRKTALDRLSKQYPSAVSTLPF